MTLLATFFGFWVLYPVLVMLMLMFAWVAYEKPVAYPSVTLIAFVLVLQFLGGVPIGQSIAAHPVWMLVYAVGYFVAGLLYTRYYKLWYFCRNRAEEYAKAKSNYMEQRNPSWSNHHEKQTADQAWAERWIDEFPEFCNGEFSIASYKGKIIAWITYWPWFLVWSLVHDLLREIGDFIYLKCKDSFERVAKKIYASILADMTHLKKSKD